MTFPVELGLEDAMEVVFKPEEAAPLILTPKFAILRFSLAMVGARKPSPIELLSVTAPSWLIELIGGPRGERGLVASTDLLRPLLELVEGEEGRFELDEEVVAFEVRPGVFGFSTVGELACLVGSKEDVLRRGRFGEEV